MIDYFSTNLWQLWIVIGFVCLILELMNGDFFLLCFALSGFATALLSLTGIGGYGLMLLFALMALICIFFIRPIALRHFHHQGDTRTSNMDAIIGRTGRVSTKIEAGGYGRVRLDGDDWKAQSSDGTAIDLDTPVKILKAESLIITVEKI